MIVTSYKRGHCIYWDNNKWRYEDNNLPINYERPCKRCGQVPTKEGYDACLGYIEGASSACCGHGVQEGYIKLKEE